MYSTAEPTSKTGLKGVVEPLTVSTSLLLTGVISMKGKGVGTCREEEEGGGGRKGGGRGVRK